MAIYNRFNSVTTEISTGDIADVTGFVSYSTNYGYQIYPRDNNDINIHPVVVLDTVATPEISFYRSGEFYFMHLACATDGADIHYTFDGSVPDENANLFTSDVPFQLNVQYTIKAIAMKEGMTNSEVAVYDYNPSGIADHELRNSLIVYPNPAIDFVTVSVKDESTAIEKAELYNVYGQLLRTVETNSNNATISISDLATGTYIVKIFSNKGTASLPIIRK